MKKVRQTAWPYLILVSGPLDPLAKDVLGGEGRLVDVDGPNLKVALLAGGDCVAAVAAESGGGMPLKAAKALAALDVPDFDGTHAGC